MKIGNSTRLIDTPEVKATIKRVAAALKGWRWCLIGGRAVEVHSNPPQTPDIDVLVFVNPNDKGELLSALRPGFRLETRLDDEEDESEFPMLFLRDRKNGIELDVVGAFEDIHFWTLDRAEDEKVAGIKIPVATAEDVVVLKSQAALSRGDIQRRERDEKAIVAIADFTKLNKSHIKTTLFEAQADMSHELSLLRKLGVL